MSMVDLRYKTGKDGRAKALWHDSATPEERAEIKQIDRRIMALAKERQALSQRRYTITNRCTVRTLARRGKPNGQG